MAKTENSTPVKIEEIADNAKEGVFEVTEGDKTTQVTLSDQQILQMIKMTPQERANFLHVLGKL